MGFDVDKMICGIIDGLSHIALFSQSYLRYFLPEDGDIEDTPNVFLAPKPSRPGYPPLLKQVKGSFPLPGRYHFRFKSPLVPGSDREKGAVAIWMDCVDDSEPVPVWQNSIIAKVTRISLEDDDDVDYAGGEEFTRVESNVSIASGNRPLTANPSADNSLLGDSFDEPLAPAPSANSSSNSLLDDHLPAHNLGGSLLDMDHLGSAAATSARSTTTSVHHDDFLNMMAAPAPTHPPQGGAMPAQHRPQPMQQPMQQPMLQPMQHGRPTQQMGGQYPAQYPPQGQYAGQGMSQMPTPQQMQQQQRNMQNGAQQQRSMQNGANGQKMSMSGNTLDPLGGLNWNMK